MTDPIDDLHTECLMLRHKINALYDLMKIEVAQWEPSALATPPESTSQAAARAADTKGNNHAT